MARESSRLARDDTITDGMSSERWRQIEELSRYAASDRETAERAWILARTDTERRLKVESLLARQSGEMSWAMHRKVCRAHPNPPIHT